jgi:TPP-dependent 2-oxoacid decarboxylase
MKNAENAKLIISIGGLKSDFNTGNFTYHIPSAHTIEVSACPCIASPTSDKGWFSFIPIIQKYYLLDTLASA